MVSHVLLILLRNYDYIVEICTVLLHIAHFTNICDNYYIYAFQSVFYASVIGKLVKYPM